MSGISPVWKVGGLPLTELNQLELQFLLLNDFRLMISKEEMQRYAEQLIHFSYSQSHSHPQSQQPLELGLGLAQHEHNHEQQQQQRTRAAPTLASRTRRHTPPLGRPGAKQRDSLGSGG